MAIRKFDIELVWGKMISPHVKHLAFKPLADDFNYIPGQFITLLLDHEGKTVRRSYSIASTQQSSELIEFAFSYIPDGIASERLMALQPGDTLHAMGPAGKLVLKENKPKRYFFIATGTGVTPYRSMLHDLDQKLQDENAEMHLLFGVRTRDDLLYGDEFSAFADRHENFYFHSFFSRLKLDEPIPYEYEGYISRHLDAFNFEPQTDMVYLCGNPHMIDEVFAYLKDKSLEPQQIIREKYISSGTR